MRTRVALGALCIAVACSGGDGQSDAGVDARPVDVGVDVPPDVLLDATDAAAIDAPSDADIDSNVDAALAPDDPGWTRLPGFPDACFVERARQPEAVLSFHWEPCADSLPSCQMAVLDRSVAPLDRVVTVPSGNDSRGVLWWRLLDRDGGRSIFALIDSSHVLAAWRAGPFLNGYACDVSPAAGQNGVGVETWFTGVGRDRGAWVGVAQSSDLSTLLAPVWSLSDSVVGVGDFLEVPSSSETTFAAMTTTGHIVAVEPPTAGILGDGGEPVVVGHSVLWNWGDATGATAIHVSALGGRETEIYGAPSGTHLYGVRADGAWITWRAGADDPTGVHFPLNELWAAPYSETGPLVAQRSWTDLVNSGRSGAIGDGMFAYDGYDATLARYAIYAVRLSDGARYEYALPFDASSGGVQWGIATDPAWVTRDEVVFPAGRVHGSERLYTALRIDLTALTPQPLP